MENKSQILKSSSAVERVGVGMLSFPAGFGGKSNPLFLKGVTIRKICQISQCSSMFETEQTFPEPTKYPQAACAVYGKRIYLFIWFMVLWKSNH